ncbi:MAG: InlB B-repeat-containing protein [Clostridia bacterium]|nr:InlB B-repeat-containing protein [Clostridia bacterium]
MKKTYKLVSILLTMCLIWAMFPLNVFASDEIITSANITIPKPVGGESPSYSDPIADDNEKYWAQVEIWYKMIGAGTLPVGAGGQFETHSRYTLRVRFYSKPGYTFADDCVFTFNGEETGSYGLDTNVFRYTYWYAADPLNPTYTVSFNADGGSGTMPDETGVFDTYEIPWPTFTAPAGQYFDGWMYGGYLRQPGDTIHVLDDTTLRASWEDIPDTGYTISFYPNEGTGTMADITNYYGAYTLPECTFTPPDGKVFDCWMILGVEKDAGTKINVGVNTSVIAVWKDAPAAITTYTLAFDANGGSGTMTALTGSTSYTLPECTFTAPAGKQFAGWNVFGYTQAAGTTVNLTNNFTAAAVWEDIPQITTVTATVNGAIAGATAGSTTVTPADATYTTSILGWYDCDNVFSYGSATKLQTNDKFIGGKTYTVGVRFTPVGSNVLANNVDATINGEDGKIGNFDGNSRDYYITISIPAKLIQSADVYVDPPIIGSKLDYTTEVTGTPAYTTEVRRWFKGGNVGVPGPEITDANALVEPDTNYVLDFTIAPKDGYTLDNSTIVKVNGTQAMRVGTVSGTNIGVYRVEFTSPKIEIVNANAIITVPVAGENPSYTVASSDPDKYDVAVNKWFNYDNGNDINSLHVFEGGTNYAVRIVFTPKPGYTFIGATNYTVNNLATSGYGEPSACQIVFAVAQGTPPQHDFNTSEWGYKDNTGHAHLCETPGCINHHDTIEPHIPSEWIYDVSVHYKKCTECDFLLEREPHVDNNDDGYCDICEEVEYVTVEIPFIKVIEQTGDKTPGKKTFEFEIFDFGHSEAADHVEIVANAITTNGTGNFDGVFKLKLTKKGYLEENYLDEGFFVKEIVETAEGWEYSTAIWYAVPNFNGVGWIFYVVENDNINWDEKDEMIFTNSYKANNPVVEEDEKEDTEPEKEPEKQPETQSPQTGDISYLFIINILSLVSLAFIYFKKTISAK